MVSCNATQRLKKVLPLVKKCREANRGRCEEKSERKIMGDEPLGKGIHRRAYEFKGQKGSSCVVKLPMADVYRTANIAEIEGYKKLPQNAKKYFLEVSDYEKHGEWITQPKVNTLRQLGISREDKIVIDFGDKLRSGRIYCDDLHAKNLGIHLNKSIRLDNIKVLDYGFGVCYMDKTLSSKSDIETKQSTRQRRRIDSSTSSERLIQPSLFKMFD